MRRKDLSVKKLLLLLIFGSTLYGQELRDEASFKALLKQGINTGLPEEIFLLGQYFSEGASPLIMAAQLGDAKLVSELLGKGADINARDKWNWTALFEAAEQGHGETAALLLEAGSEIDTVEFEYDWTPLLAAADRGHGDIVRMLVEKGAFIHAKDRFGDTPLIKAAYNGDRQSLGLLLSKGANLENRDFKGASALMIAAKNGEIGAVRFLLQAGASPWAIDNDRKTARDYAREEGESEIEELLKKSEEDSLLECSASNGDSGRRAP